jgi:hypothetical protein
MIDGGNGLTSWFECLVKNKLTMFGAHCPFIPLVQLAESKVLVLLLLEFFCALKPQEAIAYFIINISYYSWVRVPLGRGNAPNRLPARFVVLLLVIT